MAKKLTADLVMNGKDTTKDMTVEIDGEEFEITIRPLSNSEQSKSTAIGQSGITMHGTGGKMQTRAGLDKVTTAAFKADVYVVATGLVEPQMTEKQIFDSILPVEKVAKRIREISGMPVNDDNDPEKDADTGVTEFNEGSEFRDDEDGGE